MDYAEFDTERRRITHAWGREITSADGLATAVDDLREQAASIPDAAGRTRATRYLENLDALVAEARTPESETVRAAGDVLLEASRTDGTADEIRARAEAGIAEITRIADQAPTVGERDAVLEMNETLAETLAVLDSAEHPGSGPESAGREGTIEARTAGFANDPAMTSPSRMPAPDPAASASRPGPVSGPKSPIRDL
jgi:hypothetical protein